ncbi:MAG: hypothetical protein KF832_05330 [Caldilineaceae bacterium]|nr:hypothetical protein [Caldilineaceae bacterium]
MSSTVKQRLAALVTTIIFGYILLRVIDRLFLVVWVQMPWWGLLIAAVVLYLLIDHLVHRLLR